MHGGGCGVEVGKVMVDVCVVEVGVAVVVQWWWQHDLSSHLLIITFL